MKTSAGKLIPFFKTVAIYFVAFPADSPSIWAIAIKCAPIISLIVFVFLNGVGFGNKYRYPRYIITGLCFSCVGDALLVYDQYFILGMGVFGLAQITYINAFGMHPLKINLAAGIFATTLVVNYGIWGGARGPLGVAVAGYSVLLAGAVWRALARLPPLASLTAQAWPRLAAAVGATLFALSDSLIALNMFYAPIKYAQILIMSTYYVAQLGIALSVMETQKSCGQQVSSPTTIHLNEKKLHSN